MRLLFRMLLIVAGISLSSAVARAEEGGAGHYFPGGLSSFIDMLPDETGGYTLGYLNDSTYYHGSNIAFRANATSYTDTSVFLYQFPGPIPILPGKAQYSVALAVPYTWLKVHAPVINSKGMVIPAKDTDNGFGDVEMFPIMLGWTNTDRETYSLKYQTEFGIYAPTGNFESGAPANIGRNYWTFEPSGAVSYLSYPTAKIPFGIEFTSSVGFDFDTKNGATHYQSGDQFHMDGTLAAHLPLLGEGCKSASGQRCGIVGAGVSGFFYQQITGDSGSGATLGGFEGMTTGVGPALSYIYQDLPWTFGAEVKWLPELSVSNRLNGNIVWLKLAVSWGATRTSLFATNVAAPVQALGAIPAL